MGSDSRSSKRKKKRSQKHSKKSRSTKEKSKTKKPKRRHDSDSSSGEDVPSNKLPLSCSSSSSEDVYRSKKRGRPRDRRDDRKSSKKKTKRATSMSETSDESPRVKKKKKSKSSRDSKLKKKRHRKSHRSEHSDDSGRENERKEEKLETKKRKGRETSRERSVSKSRNSSRSYSPYNYNEERIDCQPKRLKSVIVVEIEKDEPKVEELIRDSHEDEIVYDHDDYPSKSNDSYDGPSGKDAVTYYSDEKTRSFEDPNREAISNDVNVGSTVDDLEAMLRQKALENLLKRQAKGSSGNISTDKKESHPGPRPESHGRVLEQTVLESKSDVKSSSPVRNELVRNQTNKEGKNVDVVQHTSGALGTLNNNKPLPRYSEEKGNVTVGHNTLIRPKVGLITSTRRLVGSSNTWRRESAPQEPLKPSQTLTKDTELTKGVESDPPGIEVVKVVDNTTASEPPPSSGVKSTEIETKEDDEESEFQQKTMTVMRGGELVQVSYKVKIPKKAPALARRQLKR